MSILTSVPDLRDKDAQKLELPPEAQVVMATGNAHKVQEVEEILRPLVPSLRPVDVPILADDSGLSVDILGGAPGIFSARWCGHHGDDRANLELLLNQLQDMDDSYRTAAFICAAVLLVPGGGTYLGNGVMGGRLVREPKGKNGFGYDPIFIADGQKVTNGELSNDAKNAISHRAKAFIQIAPQLEAILGIRTRLTR